MSYAYDVRKGIGIQRNCFSILFIRSVKDVLQSQLFGLVKKQLNPEDSLGFIVSDLLSISMDAAYRRIRLETPLTIQETKKLCTHYNISFDKLIQLSDGNVLFNYTPLELYDFSLENYLEGILQGLARLKALKEPKANLTINNVHFFQALNFPQLIRFRLYFWAQTHLMIPSYQNTKFKHEKISERAFDLGRQILQSYNQIETVEILDMDLMKGFMRQIVYYLEMQMFDDPSYAVFLIDRVEAFLGHYQNQISIGKKYIFGTEPPAQGNHLEVFVNDTINTDATFLYGNQEMNGVYLTHNIMSYLHTTDEAYVRDTKSIIDRQISNSSKISETNLKQRTTYFNDLGKMVSEFKNQVETLINR